MPEPVVVKINSKTYNIPILNVEMDNIVQQIDQNKEDINRNRRRLNDAKNELENNNNALLLLYIQQTGQYPPE
jgi:predicted  nucleic acid-binding Zn-ribbon protein